MKRLIILSTVVFATILMSACQKDDGRGRVNFNLQIADRYGSGNSKIYLDGSQPKFIANEEIQINDEIYLIDDRNGEATVYDVAEADHYYAIFPASWVVGSASATPSITFPDMQTYKKDASNNQIIESPMAAYAAGNASTLQFHNAAALATVVIKNTKLASSYNVKYVTIRSDNTFLSGVGIIDSITYGTPKIKLTSGSYNASIDCSGADAIGYGDSLIVTLAIPPVKNIKLYVDVLMTDGSDNKYSFSNKTGSEKTIRRNERGFIRVNLDGTNTKSNGYFWGNGDSPTDPYQIRTYDDLNKLRELVNAGGNTDYNANDKYYIQIADINIGENDKLWGATGTTHSYGIGYSTSYPFKANYNGEGHTITLKSSFENANLGQNWNYGIGVFGVCGGGGSITNLKTKGSISATSIGKINYGGIVGLIGGDFSIDNCESRINFTFAYYNNNYKYNGGICGVINAPSSTVNISKCKFAGNLDTDGDVRYGSIVAMVKAANSCFISKCRNTTQEISIVKDSVGGIVGTTLVPITFSEDTNNMTLNASGKKWIGGMVGYANVSLNIEKCVNNGQISCSIQAGGMVGYATSNVEMKGCKNTNIITCTSTQVGGMIGYSTGKLKMEDCENTGDITGTQYIGGCIGQCAGDTTKISGSMGKPMKNSGTIRGTASNTTINTGGIIGYASAGIIKIEGVVSNSGSVGATVNTSSNVGGIVGSSQGVITLNGTITNTGAMSAGYNVAGIVGFTNQNSSFTGCANSGTITASKGSSSNQYNFGLAGILGRSSSGTISFNQCKNTGLISALSGEGYLYVGGIAGYLAGSGHIFNCCNEGEISVTNVRTVGGIVATTNATDTIVNCYNKGSISGSINSITYACVGGILGVACTTATYINNCYNTVDVTGCTGANKEYSIAGAYNGTLTLYNCYGPSDRDLIGNAYGASSPTKTSYRCATFIVSEGEDQGKLDGDPVGVAELNNTGAGSGSYSTLKEALAAWVTKQGGTNYVSWTDATFPSLSW